jgi:hypothetical protein
MIMYESTREGRAAIRAEVHLNWDDPWGSALSNLGGICDLLYLEGGDIPDSAGYSPGCGPAMDDYPAAMFDEMFTDREAMIADFEYWARVLDRYADLVPEAMRY